MPRGGIFPPSKVICCIYCSVPGKCPLPGKRPCTPFQGVNVARSIQTYGVLILGKRPCGPKSRVMFKRQWTLTRDTTVHVHNQAANTHDFQSNPTMPRTCSRHIHLRGQKHAFQSIFPLFRKVMYYFRKIPVYMYMCLKLILLI